MKLKIDWWEVLDLFCWGIQTLSRPSISRALRGFDEERFRTPDARFWRRLEDEQWVVRRGRGAQAQFTITSKGREQCAQSNPRQSWDKKWDRRWRLIAFDVPETRRKDRVMLWRELRAQRFGLLQRSVWIWPHPAEAILRRILHATGMPECFAGFECSRIFLCTETQMVRTAWDFERIGRTQAAFLKQADRLVHALRSATSIAMLCRAARQERLAYQEAMENDPLLPRVLWPDGYRGQKVQQRHEEARKELGCRFLQLASKEL